MPTVGYAVCWPRACVRACDRVRAIARMCVPAIIHVYEHAYMHVRIFKFLDKSQFLSSLRLSTSSKDGPPRSLLLGQDLMPLGTFVCVG